MKKIIVFLGALIFLAVFLAGCSEQPNMILIKNNLDVNFSDSNFLNDFNSAAITALQALLSNKLDKNGDTITGDLNVLGDLNNAGQNAFFENVTLTEPEPFMGNGARLKIDDAYSGYIFNQNAGLSVVDSFTGYATWQSASSIDGVTVDGSGNFVDFGPMWINYYSPYGLHIDSGGGQTSLDGTFISVTFADLNLNTKTSLRADGNITMTSPNGTKHNCGVTNAGIFQCT